MKKQCRASKIINNNQLELNKKSTKRFAVDEILECWGGGGGGGGGIGGVDGVGPFQVYSTIN